MNSFQDDNYLLLFFIFIIIVFSPIIFFVVNMILLIVIEIFNSIKIRVYRTKFILNMGTIKHSINYK